MRKKQRRIWPYLVYLVLVTSVLISVTLSRYATRMTGTGTALVASMASDLEPSSFQFTIGPLKPGDTSIYSFLINNYEGDRVSEVSQIYSISLETTGNLPLTFEITGEPLVQPEEWNKLAEADPGQNSMSGGRLPHTQKVSHSYEIKITWPSSLSDPVYQDEIDLITVTVAASQATGSTP
ncbi:hypothetical protein [Anaerolentibacter hominis]|uniref:hypothetical protein n=1 Tax=Anaerolentibacter hominis TaxID=3079009 RepID=UPI0031B84886